MPPKGKRAVSVATVSREKAVADPAPFISEGMRVDLEAYGWVIDPNTGKKITKTES